MPLNSFKVFCKIWSRCCGEHPEQETEKKNTAKIPYVSRINIFFSCLSFCIARKEWQISERTHFFHYSTLQNQHIFFNTVSVFFSHKKNHKKKHHSRHIRFTKLTKLPRLIEKYEYQKYVFEHNFLHNYRRTLKLRSPEYVKCQSGIPFWLRRSQYSKSQVAEVYV